ncbi:unnamed protein product [Prorocentrum cordatum]|uniref:Uncharacterized protein n=1 Tax=Prorocentrum cordatum TaxID=2364126 RepID=A0ABN9YD86_9DINO|nr:unnamed protein product [Polarella glacialis]
MAQLAGDPTIQVLRKGVTRSFKDFAQKHPDWFTYAEENTNGKFMQMVYLSDGYHTTPINEVTLKQRTERLLFKIGTILKATDSGGLPVSALGADPAVRDLRKGVAAGLKQFLQKHAGHFRLEDADATSEKGEPMKVLTCHLVEMPPEPPPPPEPEPGAEEAADGTQWVAAQAALEWPGARAQDAWASQGQWGSWVGVGGNGDAALDAAGKQAAVALASMGAAVQAGAKGKGKGAPGLPAEGPKILVEERRRACGSSAAGKQLEREVVNAQVVKAAVAEARRRQKDKARGVRVQQDLAAAIAEKVSRHQSAGARVEPALATMHSSPELSREVMAPRFLDKPMGRPAAAPAPRRPACGPAASAPDLQVSTRLEPIGTSWSHGLSQEARRTALEAARRREAAAQVRRRDW